jgi:hypothetical protein
MYKVVVSFRDLQDNGYRYHVGDNFPHDGLSVSNERIDELLTDKNRRHTPMIVEETVTETEPVDIPEVTEEKPKRKGRKKADVN